MLLGYTTGVPVHYTVRTLYNKGALQRYVARFASRPVANHVTPPHLPHGRGTSPPKNSAPLGPCSRTMARALWKP